MASNTTTKKRGRKPLTPKFVEVIAAAPEGQPVVVKATKSYALAYHHKKRLSEVGIDASIVAPHGEREIGTGTVTNIGKSYALVAAATGEAPRKKDRNVKVVVV